ncbi:multisubunit sodium/proton antiporter, MrpF subunit [Quadrisphaera granulorum]|uniref:Multisubunit sodium/proton antiporter MrpF subunit n=1 Tax=Quadrisphaera granulorum TaxID=317664 RepID=A0A316AZS0_9ACTN|nr:monovalent cation/H+ antiporter complex subunit F [Quadrisphaera granulorum]PWJ55727.1 multisubunit sodium/proton antiporter MrpF subunit [Quadrisphaera granulorum]SZE95224.1 multisubunit sodium/proton antiporter, MrpF subunit [Quadrisphaera granulorum]
MDVVTDVALGVLLVSALLVVVRLVRGPTTLDRAAAADVFVAILLCGVAVLVARRGSTVFVPVLLALSLLGFASSVAVVRFLSHGDPSNERKAP